MPTLKGDTRTSKSAARQICILVFTSLTFVINLAVIIFAVYVIAGLRPPANSQVKTAHSLHDNVGTIACIKCDQWSGDVLLESLQRRQGSGTEQLCCAESTAQISTLMELILRKPEVGKDGKQGEASSDDILDSIKAGNFNFSIASAHKRLQPVELFDSTKDPTPVFKKHPVQLRLNHSYNDASLEHARGVLLLESGFEIRHPGTYHVYSSVRFKPDSSRPCNSFKYKIWEHTVVKGRSEDKKEEILKSVYTCCDKCATDRETSFASGVFILKEGEKLSVEISGSGLISYFYQSSYFGLMMLGRSHSEGAQV